jgi:hypothetical protein
MAGRAKTPDIMGQLLHEKPEAQPQKPARRHAGTPAHQRAPEPAKVSKAEVQADKLKATFYLSPEASEALEDTWMKLRALAGSERGKVSKSALVELALQDLHAKIFEPKKAEATLRALMST